MNETFKLAAELIFFDSALFVIYRRIRYSHSKGDGRLFYPAAVALIGFLINAAPFVCSVHMAVAPVTVGGIALIGLTVSDSERMSPRIAPNQSTDPTLASGTPPAGQESRHP